MIFYLFSFFGWWIHRRVKEDVNVGFCLYFMSKIEILHFKFFCISHGDALKTCIGASPTYFQNVLSLSKCEYMAIGAIS